LTAVITIETRDEKLGADREQRRQCADEDQRTPVDGHFTDIEGRLRARAEEVAEDRLEVDRLALGDGRSTDGEFEHQIPADDPRHELAEGGVGEGVRAAGDRDRRGELA
jgi:hypothetical protein